MPQGHLVKVNPRSTLQYQTEGSWYCQSIVSTYEKYFHVFYMVIIGKQIIFA